MWTNYLRTALRRLRSRKGYALLHVAGLSIGLACCFLVLLYVHDELSFDRFHEHSNRLFKLAEERIIEGNEVQLQTISREVAEAMEREVPSVQTVVQTQPGAGNVRRPEDAATFREDRVLYATERFFEVFTFPLLRGDPATALDAPNAAVLTAEAATKYFGDADPVGRTLLLARDEFDVQETTPLALTITGIAADPPANSSIQFDLVVSGTTQIQDRQGTVERLAEGGTTFVLARTAEDQKAVAAALGEILKDRDLPFGSFSRAIAAPLPSLHLTGESRQFAGNRRYLYLFSTVALIILLIACINYINLATAYAAQRAKEVGVRKVVGAGQGQLARQFLAETLLTALLAFGMALVLTTAALPAFNHIFGKSVTLSVSGDLSMLLAMLGIAVLVGLLAGTYPALYLARFRPSKVLKGDIVRGQGGTRLRKGLVVVQFAVTVVLLTATVVIYQQLQFAQTRDLGFDGDQVLTLDLSTPTLGRRADAIRGAMEALPGVRETAFSSDVPGTFSMVVMASPVDTPDDPSDDVPVRFADAGADLAMLYGLDLVAGRFFNEGDQRGVVLNAAGARQLGLMEKDPSEAVGKHIHMSTSKEILGVLKDFHLKSLHQEIGPLMFQPLGDTYNALVLSVKLDAANIPDALASVERTWERLAPDHPFTYTFVDETFDALYRADRQLGQIFAGMAGVAILLACLGLFGLAAFAAERRTKEVGIRKVLGASVPNLVHLLSSDFAGLVLVAFAVGAPVAAILMRRWLDTFAYRVELGPGPFLLVGAVILALATVTVAIHALRTASADPIESLRYE